MYFRLTVIITNETHNFLLERKKEPAIYSIHVIENNKFPPKGFVLRWIALGFNFNLCARGYCLVYYINTSSNYLLLAVLLEYFLYFGRASCSHAAGAAKIRPRAHAQRSRPNAPEIS